MTKHTYNLILISLKSYLDLKSIIVAIILFSSFLSSAQYSNRIKRTDSYLYYDELLVSVFLDGNTSFKTNIIITNTELIYLNVQDLFSKLEISCQIDKDQNLIEGFVGKEGQIYMIDYRNMNIIIGNKTYNFENDYIEESGVIYIKSNVYKDAFGIIIEFNPRSIFVNLHADFELPIYKKLRLEKTRNNISKLKGEAPASDTIINRKYKAFNFGNLDWAVNTVQIRNGNNNYFLNLGLGAELLFGELNVSLNHNNLYKFDNRQLQYSWRWIDNDNPIVKQAQLGRVNTQTITFLNSPIVGGSISNAPTSVRKASGFYTINEYTEPNWTVELYINDVLVDFTKADAAGLFAFKVPNVYGYSTLKFRYFGPGGQERFEERTVNIPYTFLPERTFEYHISGGVLQANSDQKFAIGNFNYGLNRFITLGGGMEYLSSLPKNPVIPFGKISIQPLNKVIINYEYAHNVRMKAILNYNLSKGIFLEFDWAKYEKDQLVTRFNALEEKRMRITAPYRIKRFSGFAKFSYNQFSYEAFDYNNLDFVLSTYYKKLSLNTSTTMNWIDNNTAFVMTNLSASYRIINDFVLRPSIDYNISTKNPIRYRLEIEKRVENTFFCFSYERNVMTQNDNFNICMRHDLPFARTSFSAAQINNKVIFSQGAQGSLSFGGNDAITPSNNSSVGKGGILFYPFLDLNQNGKRDDGEKMILLSTVRVSGGRAKINESDSIVNISNLNAFVYYNVEFSDIDLPNISWKLKNKSYQVFIDPNQYKKVDVPIISMGEISGYIYFEKENEQTGLGRVVVEIFDTNGQKLAETMSESDGYYSYLGLAPGEYVIKIQNSQLTTLSFKSVPEQLNTPIKMSFDGDYDSGLDFVLKNAEK